ncbi:MAG: RDD family protein [Chlamydiae bacterium]|nr:RDD family protein [Chlamydiota bacterium]
METIKNSYFYRIVARLIDYSFLYLIATAISFLFSVHQELFSLIAGFAIPVAFAPIEAVWLTTLGTTPGKALCGLSVRDEEGKKLSFWAALKRSFFIGGKKRPGQVIHIEQRTTARTILGICFASVCIFASLFLTAIKDYQGGLAPLKKSWSTHSYVTEKFEVEFPKKPVEEEKQLDVPDTNHTINYQEVRSETRDVSYAVSYLDFPKKWRLLGTGTLLRKSLEILISAEEGAELVTQKVVMHQNYPALDFIYKRADQEIKGRMVLIGTTLYRLAVSYPNEISEKLNPSQFIDSFKLPGS